jgi:hypothetical protein
MKRIRGTKQKRARESGFSQVARTTQPSTDHGTMDP